VEVAVETERSREDEWFARNEKEMLEAARVARDKRERERAEHEAVEERQRLKQLHFMKCPKCGHDLAEREVEGVTVDQCSFCEGVFLDAGEPGLPVPQARLGAQGSVAQAAEALNGRGGLDLPLWSCWRV